MVEVARVLILIRVSVLVMMVGQPLGRLVDYLDWIVLLLLLEGVRISCTCGGLTQLEKPACPKLSNFRKSKLWMVAKKEIG